MKWRVIQMKNNEDYRLNEEERTELRLQLDEMYARAKQPTPSMMYEMLNDLRTMYANSAAGDGYVKIYDMEYFEFLVKLDCVITWLDALIPDLTDDIKKRCSKKIASAINPKKRPTLTPPDDSLNE